MSKQQEAATGPCPAWGQFASDDRDTRDLRRFGVQISGPCKLPAGHDEPHSLDAPNGSEGGAA